LLAVLAAAPSCTAPPAPPRGGRVVLVAVDGAGWPLLAPLLSRGELPHLARLYRSGAAGILKGAEPLSPAPVWTTVATGRPARAHGILFDAARVPGMRMLRETTADQRRSAALWEIASARGITVGVADWPATWPAGQVQGFLVAEGFSGETAGARGYLHPAGALGAGGAAGEGLALPEPLRPAADTHPDLARAFAEDMASLSRALSLHRVHQPRLLLLRFRSIDAAAHRFWQYHEPHYLELAASRGELIDAAGAGRLRDSVTSSCRLLDAWVGLLLERLPDDATLILASGWGLRGVRLTDDLHVDLPALLDLLGHGDASGSGLFALEDRGRVPRALYLDAPAAGRAMAPRDEARVRRAGQDLRAIATEAGEPLFQEVTVTGEAGSGPAIELTENLAIDPMATLRLGGRTLEARDLYRRYGAGYAAHDPEGLLLAAGTGIAAGSQGWTADLADVAPTILALLGLPAAEDMPGRAIPEVSGQRGDLPRVPTWDGAWPLPQPARREDTDAKAALERLRSSGHLP
jgi:hypothetical protein